MEQPERYQVLVLSSGAGGKLLAWHLARSRHRTAVVERRWIGGSCPNIACLPSKNEIWSAKVADFLRHGAQFGVAPGSFAVDMAKVRQRKRDMVDGLIAMHLDHYKASGFGSRVTLVEPGSQLLAREDPDVADEIRQILAGEGIEILLASDVLQVKGRSGEGVRVRTAAGERPVAASDILAATGRTPNTNGIGLDVAGGRAGRAGLCQGQLPARDERARRLGDRRVCRQPTVHARLRRRLSDYPGQPRRRDPQHARPPRPLLLVYGPAAGASRPERAGSPATGNRRACREPADERSVADAGDR